MRGSCPAKICRAAAIEKQRASLQTYLASLPYDAESEDEMRSRLEFILGRIIICAEAKNWLVLATWDGVLQWCALTVRLVLLLVEYWSS
jgi:proteasome activator subunit 4